MSHARPGAAAENPWAGQGSVLLDIGGDVGALVVEMPREMTGTEVEIRRVGRSRRHEGHVPHVAVVARAVGSGSIPSLVFPELRAGRYRLSVKGTDLVVMTVLVRGGRVTDARWPPDPMAGVDAAPSSGRAGGG
jgi:hypothetical protein